MTKARITYRFDTEQRSGRSAMNSTRPSSQEQAEPNKVIRLFDDEYQVQRDETDPAASVENQKPSFGPIVDGNALNQFTTDFGAWSSPFDAETERVERLIRESGRAAYTEEQQQPLGPRRERERNRYPEEAANSEPEFAWQEQKDEPVYQPEFAWQGQARYVPRKGAPWLKIFASAVGAVATGAVFGYLVLSLFNGGNDAKTGVNDWLKLSGDGKTPSVAASAPAASGASGGAAASGAAAGTPATTQSAGASAAASGTGSVAVKLPSATYSLIQSGVFSNQEGADKSIADLKKKGLAASSETAEKVYVYAGLGLNRDDALLLSSELQDKKLDVYIKSMTLPAVTALRWNGKAGETPEAYLTDGMKLTQTIAGLSVMHLQEKNLTAPDEATMKALKAAHQTWSQEAVKAADGFPKEAKAITERMNTAMNTAVLSLEEYGKNPSETFLWQSQGALLTYILAEKELLSAVSGG